VSAMRDASPVPEHLHWSDAAYHWEHYGPPLRPAAEDVRAMEARVAAHAATGGTRRWKALLLGVTPEIATMAWPAATELLAVDKSRLMIERVWPGDLGAARRVVCADWLELAATGPRYDFVIGDGTFAILGFPRQHRALAEVVHHALAPGGMFVTRLFLRPERNEAPEAVIADLLANRIGSFHAFKLRLAMAMQRDAAAGVRMGDVHAAWERARVDRDALLAGTGWPPPVLETIRPWAGKDSRLSFPTSSETAALIDDLFEARDEHRSAIELGERCPVVAWHPRERR
jgi:SAM-dependent methyltransferase